MGPGNQVQSVDVSEAKEGKKVESKVNIILSTFFDIRGIVEREFLSLIKSAWEENYPMGSDTIL